MKEKKFSNPENQQIHEALTLAYNALSEKGYNAVAQLTGYTCTSDATYITPHNGARNAIKEYYGEDIINHLFEYYFSE